MLSWAHAQSRPRSSVHGFISDVKFERRLSIGLKHAQIYQITEWLGEVCSNGINGRSRRYLWFGGH